MQASRQERLFRGLYEGKHSASSQQAHPVDSLMPVAVGHAAQHTTLLPGPAHTMLSCLAGKQAWPAPDKRPRPHLSVLKASSHSLMAVERTLGAGPSSSSADLLPQPNICRGLLRERPSEPADCCCCCWWWRLLGDSGACLTGPAPLLLLLPPGGVAAGGDGGFDEPAAAAAAAPAAAPAAVPLVAALSLLLLLAAAIASGLELNSRCRKFGCCCGCGGCSAAAGDSSACAS